jgi:hypothetical protein
LDDNRRLNQSPRHCERSEASTSPLGAAGWIASSLRCSQ